jgi:anti-sigma factor RsiW
VAQVCKQVIKELGDYLDGLLDAAAQLTCERHFECCSPCRMLRDTTRRTLQLYRSMPVHPIPADVAARLTQALDRRGINFGKGGIHD